jgi:glycosyltransferase involved in cell wall biosynthesis
MKVNLAVCGKYHYGNFVRYVERAGLLNQFIYSHRLATDTSALGVPPDKLVNIWIKEYLFGLHLRLFDTHALEPVFNTAADLWERLALRRWRDCDLLHIMLDGTGRQLLRRARQAGSLTIGEPLNTHPEIHYAILNEEHERLGLKKYASLPTSAQRLLEALELCGRLLVPSNFVKQSFVEKGFDERRIEVIPYGVDLKYFHPAQKAEASTVSTFRVICVAQVTPRKGHVYLLEAWKKLKLPGAELLFIGPLDHSMKPVLARYEGLFKHIASVPHTELQRYYANSSVFVLPSLEDGFAHVCAEALACGLPVITTGQTGAAEIITHGTDGFIVPVRSVEDIAAHLESLSSDQERLLGMSQAAAAKAEAELSWEQYALKLCRYYHSLSAA